MKNMKRAYRRDKAQSAFLRRFKKWSCNIWHNDTAKRKEFLKDVLEGREWKFLRSTGKPCSCSCCSPYYKRDQKQYHLKDQDQGF